MRSSSKNFIFNAIYSIWVTVCLTLFVYVNRVGFVQIVNVTDLQAFWDALTHISPEAFILNLVSALAGIIIFSLSCLSLGLFIIRKWLQLQSSPLVLGVTAFLVGEITFSLIYLTLIGLYRLPPAAVALGTLFGFLLGLPVLKVFTADLLTRLREPLQLDPYEKTVLTLIIVGLLLGFFLSFSRLGYDATTYYFSHSKIMAVTQLPVFFHPNDTVVVSSFHPGILFTAIIQLFGDQAARALSWTNGIAILLLGFALGKELGFSTRTNLWFLVLMFSTTAFIDLLGDGKVELISSAPIVAALCWILQNFERPTPQTSLLIGYLLGFAIISRPYNIFLVSVFVVLLLGIHALFQYRSKRFEWKILVLSFFWMMLPIFTLGVFHLFQNLTWLKNPLAPLLYARKIEGGNWQWQFDPADLNLYRLLYPITLTFMNSPQSMGNISPLFISLLPLLLLKNVRQNLHAHRYMKWLLTAAVVTLLAWILFSFTVVEIRYVFFLWIILFLAVAPILETGMQQLGTYIRPIIVFFCQSYALEHCLSE